MKKSATLLFYFMLLTVPTFAQSQVRAEDILKSIDEGKAVEYSGVEIVGDLDLTAAQGRVSEKSFWSFLKTQNEVLHHVRVPLIFRDCVFKGDVIAYHHDDWNNETHNVVFHEDVSFQGCEFRKTSAFKYSKFHRNADFKDTTYRREALFKYAEFIDSVSFAGSKYFDDANFKYTEFSTEISFADSTFSNEANFKYTKFYETVDFTRVVFRDDANFKYTKFPRGVRFNNSIFRGDANFKYTEFSEPFDFEGIEFEDSVNFKYTKLEGSSFTPYPLRSRK